ncbi:insulin receptor-like isoform X2 [Oscarella lobularis]|uniref:insulin receptor-like isoform X2 n=1 Tax=Oscarella lobularis TaxID=121494 RepID=UPI003313BF1D
MRIPYFLIVMLTVSLLCTNAMKRNSKEDRCARDFELNTRVDVRKLIQKNCTKIDGSLHITGLEPDSCSDNGPLSLDTVSTITGCLWIENLSDGYESFEQLLPNLRQIGGKCSSANDGNYTFVIQYNRYLRKFGLDALITLENGCANIANNPQLETNVSILASAEADNGSKCTPCAHSNHFYCPPTFCRGNHSVFDESDLPKVERCLEIEDSLFFSGSWSDDHMPKLEQSLGRLRKIHGYLVIANTRGLKSLSFLKSLVSVGGNGAPQWNNNDLMHLWEHARLIDVNDTAAFIHGNPFLCQWDYEMLTKSVFRRRTHLGGGNSLVGQCNWSPESNATRFLILEKSHETTLTVSWNRIYENETQYFYIGTELFYAEVISDSVNASTSTCPPSLTDILLRSNTTFLSPQRLNIDGKRIKQHIVGLMSGRNYAVYVRSNVLSLNNTGKALFDCSKVEIFSTVSSLKLEPLARESSSIAWSIVRKPDDFLLSVNKYIFEMLVLSPSEDCHKADKDASENLVGEFKREPSGTCPCLRNCGALSGSSNVTDAELIIRQGNNNCNVSVSDSYTLVKSNGSFAVHNILKCFVYRIRAIIKNKSKCSAWSNELKFLRPICPHEIKAEMNVNATSFVSSHKDIRIVNVKWTDPVTSLCQNKSYEIKFSDIYNDSKIFIDVFLDCKMIAQSYVCKFGPLGKAEHRHIKFIFHSEPPSILPINISYCLDGEQAAVSFNASLSRSNRSSSEKESTESQPESTESHTPLIGGAAAGSLFLSVTAAVAFICLWRVKAKRRIEMNAIRDYLPEGFLNKSGAYQPDEWEIDRNCLSVGELLGEGAFGEVYEGVLEKPACSTAVAVKSLKPDSQPFERLIFLKEASVMKNFVCDYIVRLIGIISKDNPVYVVLELMGNGDLKSYLRSLRPRSESSTSSFYPLSEEQILTMAAEIASGMAYLAENKFVHRDLAARNCMVTSDKVVKIGDFGMARDVELEDYYRKRGRGPMPIRWMAPESLRDGIFTYSSDIWSYGVVLWEIAELGALPYPGLTNEDVISFVGKRKQLAFGDWPEWPSVLKPIMRRCWDYDPTSRPRFVDILLILPSLKGCEVAI